MLARQWGNAFTVHFVEMKGSSRHTFAPIDLTFCTPGIYIKVSGNLREAHVGHRHSRPRGEARLPLPLYRSVHLPSTLVDTQLPSDPSTQKWSHLAQEGGLTDFPSLDRCMYHPGGMFSLANKNPGLHGTDV